MNKISPWIGLSITDAMMPYKRPKIAKVSDHQAAGRRHNDLEL